jgi:hypothetical protein
MVQLVQMVQMVRLEQQDQLVPLAQQGQRVLQALPECLVLKMNQQELRQYLVQLLE